MGVTIGLISIKGGVGKTTVSAALATSLANHYHQKVLLVDANFSAPNVGLHMDVVAPKMTIHDVLNGEAISSAVHTQYGVDVVPGHFLYHGTVNPLLLKEKIATVKKQYDYIILDASPSLNDELLSTILASDHLFAISTPDYPTLSCTMRAVALAKEQKKPIRGIIINKALGGTYDIASKELQDSVGIPVVARLKYDSVNHTALAERTPAPLFGETQFVRELDTFSRSLLGLPEKNSFVAKFLPFRNVSLEQVNRAVLTKDFYNRVFK
jgi:MinD-like ATPase involved in chromosome partitioning or flagellar assembly